MSTKLSLCIPVHNTEGFFSECLLSLQNQDLSSCGLSQSDIEVVIINDLSVGRDSLGRDCKKIVKDFNKNTKFKVNYIVHNNKKPLIETRRELVLESKSPYIMMVDSDDLLEEKGISILYNLAISTDSDIVQGNTRAFEIEDNQIKFLADQYRSGNVYNGVLQGDEIIKSWAVDNTSSAFLWAKIIKRDLYIEAFEELLFSDCAIGEDIFLYFYIALFAEKYTGTDDNVYMYRNNSGITSAKPIVDLDQWGRICSMASGFTNLIYWIDAQKKKNGISPISEEVQCGLQSMLYKRLHSSVIQLRNYVAPEIRDEARKMLYEYWGESFVKKMELAVETEQLKNDKR